jgi:hypothetical protein
MEGNNERLRPRRREGEERRPQQREAMNRLRAERGRRLRNRPPSAPKQVRVNVSIPQEHQAGAVTVIVRKEPQRVWLGGMEGIEMIREINLEEEREEYPRQQPRRERSPEWIRPMPSPQLIDRSGDPSALPLKEVEEEVDLDEIDAAIERYIEEEKKGKGKIDEEEKEELGLSDEPEEEEEVGIEVGPMEREEVEEVEKERINEMEEDRIPEGGGVIVAQKKRPGKQVGKLTYNERDALVLEAAKLGPARCWEEVFVCLICRLKTIRDTLDHKCLDCGKAVMKKKCPTCSKQMSTFAVQAYQRLQPTADSELDAPESSGERGGPERSSGDHRGRRA